MNSKIVAVIAVCIITISAAALITNSLLNDGTILNNDKTDYRITYELDGGTNSASNPSGYSSSREYELYAAEKEGCVFIGWFLDEDFENEITKISKGTTGDLILYAYWERSEIGNQYTYDITGTTVKRGFPFNTTTTITGSISYTYMTYRYGQGYFISYDETLTTKTGSLVSTQDYSETYWSGESDNEWVMGDNATIDTINGSKECSTWTCTKTDSVEKQYLGLDDDITYRIEYSSTSGKTSTDVVYNLTGISTVVLDSKYDVDVYCDKGITVTGSGTNEAYSTVTLTAVGDSFAGWYSTSGIQLSTSRTYTIETLVSDTTVYARNNNDSDITSDTQTVSISPDIALTGLSWVLDGNVIGTENILNYTFPSAGSYTILYTGTDSNGKIFHGLYDVFVDGLITRNYTWSYDSHDYTATLNIKYSDLMTYRNSDISRSQGTNAHDLSFVTYDDDYVIDLVDQIRTQCSTMSDLDTASVMLAFTQYIEYQYDSDSMGQDEYWKYPLETLYDQNGDCEDTSILFCAMAKAAGYTPAMILFSDHMAAGINVSGASGYYFSYHGVNYYYSETTSLGGDIGDTPNIKYRSAQKVIPV